jgi:hypothetical protein
MPLDDARYKPGQKVWSMSDCGDFFEGVHVVIPRNIEGTFRGYEDRDDPHGKTRLARIDIPTSPGQKSLVCRAEEIDVFWSLVKLPKWPSPPKPRTAWTVILGDD